MFHNESSATAKGLQVSFYDLMCWLKLTVTANVPFAWGSLHCILWGMLLEIFVEDEMAAPKPFASFTPICSFETCNVIEPSL